VSKIIFLGAPAHGHVNPTLPVVKELIRRGEQVLYYNNAEFRPQIERTGARFEPYPATELTAENISALLVNGNLANVTALLLQVTQTLLPFTLAELESEQPDLLVFDSLVVWGRMASTLSGVRAVGSISHFIMETSQMNRGDTLRMLGMTLPVVPKILAGKRQLIRKFGKTAFPPSNPLFPMRGELNLLYTVAELHPPSTLIDDSYRFVGPSIDAQGQEEALPAGLRDDLPLIYISLGTVHTVPTGTVHTGNLAFFQRCFHVFADVPAQFLLSVGRSFPLESLSNAPANFILRPSVPQIKVLERASLFITHGGMNSIHEALYYGVPLVVIPQQFEQLLNGRVVAAQGAGYLIRPDKAGQEVTSAELRQAFDEIYSDPSYRLSAERLKDVLKASGGFRMAADEIQAFARQQAAVGESQLVEQLL
jgi:MGT family glycosyltransferase